MEHPDTEPGIERDERSRQRRMLMRGLASSGALVGIASPLTARATGTSKPHCVKSSTNFNATASAVGSILGSVSGTATPIAGHSASHYCRQTNWTSTTWSNGLGCALTYNNCANPSGTGKIRFHNAFNIVPAPTSGPTTQYCYEILTNYPNSDEGIWLTALLNANKRNPFSYTPSQVVSLYNNKNPMAGNAVQAGLSGKALVLFRDYLSDQA